MPAIVHFYPETEGEKMTFAFLTFSSCSQIWATVVLGRCREARHEGEPSSQGRRTPHRGALGMEAGGRRCGASMYFPDPYLCSHGTTLVAKENEFNRCYVQRANMMVGSGWGVYFGLE